MAPSPEEGGFQVGVGAVLSASLNNPPPCRREGLPPDTQHSPDSAGMEAACLVTHLPLLSEGRHSGPWGQSL